VSAIVTDGAVSLLKKRGGKMEMPLKRARSFLVISLLLILPASFSFAQRWCYALLEQLENKKEECKNV